MRSAREEVLRQCARLEREENYKTATFCCHCAITFPPGRRTCPICGERLHPRTRANRELIEPYLLQAAEDRRIEAEDPDDA